VVEATSNDDDFGGVEERVDEVVGLSIPYVWAGDVGEGERERLFANELEIHHFHQRLGKVGLSWLECSKVSLVTGLLVG
jgi:hypothetical protein